MDGDNDGRVTKDELKTFMRRVPTFFHSIGYPGVTAAVQTYYEETYLKEVNSVKTPEDIAQMVTSNTNLRCSENQDFKDVS